MTDELQTIELRSVWLWDCPSCGHVNKEDPPPIEVTDEDRAAQPEFDEEGEYAVVPETVLCAQCLSHYSTGVAEEEA